MSPPKNPLWASDDVWAVLLGGLLLAAALVLVLGASGSETIVNPLTGWLAKPGKWEQNPLQSLVQGDSLRLLGIGGVFVVGLLGFGVAARVQGTPLRSFTPAFAGVFLLALAAYVLAEQAVIKYYNLDYAVWALAVGLLISNTVGTPEPLRPALRTEFYIKTGLVLLGAELLLDRLLILGLPGICVAWVVTPIVLISTYWFGQRVLKIRSRSLNMVISADLSVCGVSAAIATAAACRAQKEELSLAIGLSLCFTVIMMIVMPAFILAVGMNPTLGGAWMGGTIDATGAVAAAGAMLGDSALEAATTIKMIQNVLIGVISFGVAVYWVARVEPREPPLPGQPVPQVGASEIWRRFPKFVLGFLGASIVFSAIVAFAERGEAIVAAATDSTKLLRGWFFCLAFVSIGLESDFRRLAQSLAGGKPLILYVVGQSLNLALTLLLAWIMFELVFPDALAMLDGA